MTKAEARLADNGSEQTVDRLHKDMTKAEARLADNGQVLAVATPWKFESSPGHHISDKAGH